MKKYIITFGVLITLFISLLYVSLLFSDSKIKSNVTKSLETYNFYDNHKYNIYIDNYTDMIILNVMTYKSGNTFTKRVFGNEYGYLNTYYNNDKLPYWNQYENLKASLNNMNDSSVFYGRYWHGNQILLRPLLSFTTYQESLKILSFIGIIIIIISLVLVFKKMGFKFLIIYILGLLLMNIYIYYTCYQYLLTYLLTIICINFILILYDENKDMSYYFFIIGSLTTYFLFVSFPLITLCFPLIMILYLKFVNGKYNNYKENLLFVIKSSINWLVGYIIFFSIKWILGYLIGVDILSDAFMSVSQRLGVTFSFSYIDVLKINLTKFFDNYFNIFITFISIVLLIFGLLKNTSTKLKIFSPFILISIMPFIWLFVINNHSAIHYWMVYRLFAITIFSFLVIDLLIFNKKIKYDTNVKFNKKEYIITASFIIFLIFYKYPIISFILLLIIFIISNKFLNIKNIKIILVLLIVDLGVFSITFISDNTLNKNDFFKDLYNELYYRAIQYGEDYVKKNNVPNNTKINIKNLITDINNASVLLYECDGYIEYKENTVKPYINCKNIYVTEGYTK